MGRGNQGPKVSSFKKKSRRKRWGCERRRVESRDVNDEEGPVKKPGRVVDVESNEGDTPRIASIDSVIPLAGKGRCGDGEWISL